MHNWKWRCKISWATFCWKRENLFSWLIIKAKWWPFILKVTSFLIMIITNNSELEWRRKQKNCRWLVHIPDQSSQYEERVLIVFKCTETNSGLETTRCFQRQFSNQRTVHTSINGQVYGQVCQNGLRLNKNVGNRGCLRTTRTEAKRTGSTLSNDS